MPRKRQYHFLFSAFPAWGHTRAFCILAARVVKETENITFTLLLSPNHLAKARAEMTAELGYEMPDDRLRVLSPCKTDSDDAFILIPLMVQTYPEAYRALSEAKPGVCAMTGKIFNAIDAPDIVFLDVYTSPQMLATRAITGQKVPIIASVPLHASCVIHLYGPERLGGNGDLSGKIEAEATRRGVTPREIGDSIFYHTEGKVIKVPGLPDMYDWEHFPQLPDAFQNTVSDVIKLAYKGLQECNSVFSLTAEDFEPVSVDALKSWILEEWDKEVFVVGPLLPSKPTTYGIESDGGGHESSEIQDFLTKTLKLHGEKSLVLISFGTLFWPSIVEYLEEVVEALIEKDFPFIISYASPFGKISDSLIDKIRLAGYGLISKWIPQKFVLDHPATGWFVTHAGQSGVLESLDSGVPMICWPFEFDQPLASAHLSENLDIAFELIEVRTGEHGIKPLMRNGRVPKRSRDAVGIEIRDILEKCRGPKGAVLRENAQNMKARLKQAWEPDGVARRDFNTFLKKYGINT
ncbi:Anthocyanidin 3-O-glucosyltransferase [Psilocybe cubensis]|uniref:UDP-Glycosyltransferase/glycogen phosphorylase n=2 Tax=Psilocybe cubensis TaxID=181762 RepID=A0A8H8CE31_PSICU|nr:Anthocyanidin 3-O-glucosyltransferase [Psilocybe cubensis]KAH9476214.1 Anthocyanidin 3-O-glucosyltransferase [Psilocybe cubensis]